MAALAGNHFAEKWTFQKTMDRLCMIQAKMHDEEVIYLGQALALCGTYKNVWRYWKKKWIGNEEIEDLMGLIDQTFESRIFLAAARKEIHAGTAMFALKHHYGWNNNRPPQDADDEPEMSILEQPSSGEKQLVKEEKQAEIDHATAEKARIRQKVIDWNTANPDQRLTIHGNYTDVRPDKLPYIEFRGGFFSKI